MQFRVIFVLFAIIFLSIGTANAQVFNTITKEDILLELEKRNLDYDEVVEALLEKGININDLNSESISYDQRITIQNVILELSKPKTIPSKKNSPNNNLDSIKVKQVLKQNNPDTIFKIVEQKDPKPPKNEDLIWGQSLLKNNSLLVKSSNNILKAPESYVLGPGDELVVSIWGRSQVDNTHVIDKNGYIKVLDNRVRVFLKGMKLRDARDKILNILKRDYSFNTGEFDLAVNYSRTLRVSIYGEVVGNPGSYAISGFNNAFNALSIVNGPNKFGSLRNIQLQKTGGESLKMDVYEFMTNPSMQSNFYLDEGDIIIVPIQGKVVEIQGAIKRPLRYELLDREGLNDLIKYAGGFTRDAYKKKIQIKRFENDEQIVLDLNWNDLDRNKQNFQLKDGDVILIEEIEKRAKNFVIAKGEIDKPAEYERIENMRLFDLSMKVGINANTSTGILYLTRTNKDGTKSLLKLNLNEVLSDRNSAQNLELHDLDVIEFWSKKRFADEAKVSIGGAVREEGTYPFDQGGSVRVRDAIRMAGGLRRDASNYATIHKNDALNKNNKYYKTIDNLYDLVENGNDEFNYLLSPFDSLVIESKNEFEEELFVRIEGAVNNPGKFQFGENMTIKDLLVLSKGFKMAASTNNIEISRVIREDNKPTSIVVALLEIDKDFNVLTKGAANGEYPLEPFDNVAVRYIKDFELQKRVFLTGEVEVPGPYAIFEDNLRISTILKKAGGLTNEAYASGATLYREEQDIGKVVIKLEEILTDENSEFNFIVKNGDRIDIPTVNEFVTIKGATRVKEVLGEGAIEINNEIKVPFQSGKDALFYINEHAGGLADNADKSKIFVEHANGEIKNTKSGFFRKRYPKVLQGSTITVGSRSIVDKEKDEREKVDWTKVLGDSVGQAMSILTLILLIQRLD